DFIYSRRRKHRSRSDQRLVSKAIGQNAYRVVGIRRIEGNLDNAKTLLDERTSDRFAFRGCDPPEDRHEGAFRKGSIQVDHPADSNSPAAWAIRKCPATT